MSTHRKILSWQALERLLAIHQRDTLVFTNGCFDILHLGHVEYLEAAKSLGDLLVVGVNSDASVQRLKGSLRPVNPLSDRCSILAALECVDYVVGFADDTPERLIHRIRPKILVKGADWEGKEVAGARFVIDTGGQVVFVPLVPERSTTRTLELCKL